MKLCFFDAKRFDKNSFAKALEGNEEVTIKYTTQRLKTSTLEKAKGSDGICTFVNCILDADSLVKLYEMGIKYIFQRSAGYNNIDLKKANELGIKVYRVPAYSPEAVAEFAMTLLTAVNRNIAIAYNRTTHKNFALEGLLGDTIFGQTIGVVGAGRIGQSFIKIAKGFGARVIVLDEFAEKNFPNTAKDLGFEYVSRETLFRESDYISLHAPLLPSTKYIVNSETLSLMKENAIIINTARGQLINTSDLLDALDYGKIRGAGLDVYENEQGIFFFDKSNDLIPDPLLNRLRAHRNVILTSHQSFFTNLALKQIAETTVENIYVAQNNIKGKDLIIQNDGKILNG